MQEFQVEVEFFDLWKIIFFSIFLQTEFFNRSEKWFNAFELEVEKIIRERERERAANPICDIRSWTEILIIEQVCGFV